MRRERNKQAAARCRKRRLDHTTELTNITEGLEEEKRKLRKELDELEQQKRQLQHSLQIHCSSNACKKQHANSSQSTVTSVIPVTSSSSSSSILSKNRRPSTLPLTGSTALSFSLSSSSNNNTSASLNSSSSNNNNSSPAITSGHSITSLPGPNDNLIPVQTPSNGLFSGLGLTPLLEGFMPSVSCGGQTRSQLVTSDAMVTSPDGPSKLVSL